MNRRDFLRAASGVAGGTAAATTAATAAADDESDAATTTTTSGGTTTAGAPNGTTTGGNATTTSGGGSKSADKTVKVGPGGSLVFEPSSITISPGTTVKWVWESDNHNIVVGSQPDGAGWEGTAGPPAKTYDTGHTYTHTFETTGTYEYWCQPHKAAGMVGTVNVKEGGAVKEIDPHHMGVPFQAHFVGLAAILGLISSLLFTFYLLKYGESPNASSPNRK